MAPFAEIPGPTPHFPLGNMLQFAGGKKPWEVCSDLGEQYGGVCCVWFLGTPALVLNDPEWIGEVLENKWREFYKDAPCAALAPVITSKSLFISNPPNWSKAREENPLAVIPFAEWFPPQLDAIRQSIRRSLQAWIESGDLIDLYTEMQRLSFRAFAQAFWGNELDDSFFDWFQTLARTGNRRMERPVQFAPPLSPFFYSARRQWYGRFEAIVAEARNRRDDSRSDLLSVFLRSGREMSDADLAEALATNFFGGVFSCSSTINTTLYLLAKHPTERKTFIDQLRTALGGEDSFDASALDHCKPLDHNMREAMRYYPAVPIYFRNVSKGRSVELCGRSIPANTLLMISNWRIHKHADFWGDPEVFRPSRWDNGFAEAHPIGSGHFFPFGRGPRMCIGADFAVQYIKLALATILLETDVELDPDQAYEQGFFFGVMMPKLKAKFQAAAARE